MVQSKYYLLYELSFLHFTKRMLVIAHFFHSIAASFNFITIFAALDSEIVLLNYIIKGASEDILRHGK